MSSWENAFAENTVVLTIDGETIRYNPETGELYYLDTYKNGELDQRVQIYKTGRGVVKFRVEGVSYRAMDVIHENCKGVALKGFQGYPANNNFSDLRLDNIVMVRTREAML